MDYQNEIMEIKRIMKKYKLKQMDISEKTGANKASISRFLRGLPIKSAKIRTQILSILEYSEDDIKNETPKKEVSTKAEMVKTQIGGSNVILVKEHGKGIKLFVEQKS